MAKNRSNPRRVSRCSLFIRQYVSMARRFVIGYVSRVEEHGNGNKGKNEGFPHKNLGTWPEKRDGSKPHN